MDTQTPTDSDREAAREWFRSRSHYVRLVNGAKTHDAVNSLAELVATGRALGLATARPTWTGTPPTVAGAYWYWDDEIGEPWMVNVYWEDDPDALDGDPPHFRATGGVWWKVEDAANNAKWSGPFLPPPIPTPAEPTT